MENYIEPPLPAPVRFHENDMKTIMKQMMCFIGPPGSFKAGSASLSFDTRMIRSWRVPAVLGDLFACRHDVFSSSRREKAAQMSGFSVSSESQLNDITRDEWCTHFEAY
jgi:hypothetical protein